MAERARARDARPNYCAEAVTYLDVEEVLGEHGGTVVNGLALSVELATKHLRRDGHLQHVTRELAMSVRVVDVGGALENLYCKATLS